MPLRNDLHNGGGDGECGTSYIKLPKFHDFYRIVSSSVTRFGDFLDFGQLFKAFGNN